MRTLAVLFFWPARRVARAGAAWCDRNEPGWAGYVCPDLIDIRSQRRCVLGQVGERRYGFCRGYGNGYATLIHKHRLSVRQQLRLGFFPAVGTGRLNAAWAAEVRARGGYADLAVLAEAAQETSAQLAGHS
jgi:hypothetical protein